MSAPLPEILGPRLEILRETLGPTTNAFRLIDGDLHGFPDLIVECFADRWLISTPSATPPPDSLRDACLELGATSIYWKQLQQDGKQAPDHFGGALTQEPFEAKENGMRFLVDFQAGYSQGIFLDQRENRDRLAKMTRDRSILNCFAYTCTFGLAAMLQGAAACTHLDLSKHYLAWGMKNYACNDLMARDEDFIFGDVAEWLRRFAKSRRTFDWIILDPPTFSRDRKGKVFRIEKDLPGLMNSAASCLNPGGGIFVSTNCRAMETRKFRTLIEEGLDSRWMMNPGSMPYEFTGFPYLKSMFCEQQK